MLDLAHYRRTAFAIVRKLELSEDDRHALNERLTGHASTRDNTEADWQALVAELQRLEGRPGVRDGKPHLRSQRKRSAGGRRPSRPYPLGNAATPQQLAYIAGLRAAIVWTHDDGPEAGFRHWAARHCFGPIAKQSVERDAWIDSNASIASLPSARAHTMILALIRIKNRQETAAVECPF